MADNFTIGLESLKGSATLPTSDSALFTGTGYTEFGHVYKDTCKLTQEDGADTEYYDETEADPIKVVSAPGKTLLAFSIMDPSVEVLKRFFGGAVTSGVYAYPDAVGTIEESILLTPKEGLLMHFPRVKLKAKIDGNYSPGGLLKVDVTGTVLKPAGLNKVYFKPKGASAGSD